VTVFIDCEYREQAPENPDHIVGDIGEAAELILSLEGKE
jgi:hypothetical protein